MTSQRLLSLIWKDWKLFLADRQAAILCFVVPVVLASAFGAIFYRSDRSSPLPPLPIYIVAESESPFAQRVVKALCSNPEVRAKAVSRPMAFSALESKTTGVVLILPKDFNPWQQTGPAKPKVEVFHHPERKFEGRWAEGALTEAFLRESAKQWSVALRGQAPPRFEMPFRVEHGLMPGTADMAVHAYSHSYCGMTVQYLLFWGMDSGLLLLRERRRGIWKRMRAAPVGLLPLLCARVASISMIALLQILVTFSIGYFVFAVQFNGSLIGFGIIAMAAALLSAATGLLVAVIGGSEPRARSLAIVAILGLSILGGLWLPSFLLPDWAQRLSLALPTTWAARGFAGATWRGADLSHVLLSAAIVTGYSVVLLSLAYWRFCRAEALSLVKGES